MYCIRPHDDFITLGQYKDNSMHSLTMQITVYTHAVFCFAWCKNSFPASWEFPCANAAQSSVGLYMGHDLDSLVVSGGSVSQQFWLTGIFRNVGLIHGPETVVKGEHLQRRQSRECKHTSLVPVPARTGQHKLIFLSSGLTSSVVQKQAHCALL